MSRYDARNLAQRITDKGNSGPILRRHKGTITDVNANGTVDLNLDGTTVVLSSIPVLTGTYLQVSDVVEVLIDDTDVFVLGKIASSLATDWIDVTFQNSWANYGSNWETCQYRRHSNGIVEIKGLMRNGTLTSTAFTLPIGFRPADDIHAIAFSNLDVGGVRIYSDGRFIPGNPGSNTWFSCRVPPFYAEV